MDQPVPAQRSKQQEDFGKLCDSVIANTDRCFGSSRGNGVMKLKAVGLHEELSSTDLEHVVVALNLTETVQMHQLCEELCASQKPTQEARQYSTGSTDEKWAAVF